MRKDAFKITIAAMGCALLSLGGCSDGSTSTGGLIMQTGSRISSGLLLPASESEELVALGGWDDTPGWESHRNDRGLGTERMGKPQVYRTVEIRTRDHRWTTNGRVRESSRTTTRTILRGRIPSS